MIHFFFRVDNEVVCRTARLMLTYALNELDSMDTCAECYLGANQNPQNYFTDVCQQPHLLIWVKMKKFPYWPAKLMSLYDNMANVRFFHEKTNARVPIVDCLMYSLDPPEATINQKETPYLRDAIQVKSLSDNVITVFYIIFSIITIDLFRRRLIFTSKTYRRGSVDSITQSPILLYIPRKFSSY